MNDDTFQIKTINDLFHLRDQISAVLEELRELKEKETAAETAGAIECSKEETSK